uniref:Uncharacterized protein n=1 Tax=Aegilops tauschii subsp. strangulata TaxID=200361 RepID=A0A453TDX5_AEGTS
MECLASAAAAVVKLLRSSYSVDWMEPCMYICMHIVLLPASTCKCPVVPLTCSMFHFILTLSNVLQYIVLMDHIREKKSSFFLLFAGKETSSFAWAYFY